MLTGCREEVDDHPRDVTTVECLRADCTKNNNYTERSDGNNVTTHSDDDDIT